MVDPFVILAPVLLLAVVALLRFLGCSSFEAAPDPTPTLTGLDPDSAIAGGPDFPLTVTGTAFQPTTAKVHWNGQTITPSPGASATQLTVQIPANNIATVGSPDVQVFNDPSGPGSNVKKFTIKPVPVPNITRLDPLSKLVCEGQFSLKVFGSNFVNDPDPLKRSRVRWNGSDRTTTFISDQQLEATIPAADIAELDPGQAPKTVNVTVFNPPLGGGSGTSTPPLTFKIDRGTPNAVRFDPKPAQVTNSGDILNGTYKNIDFLINQWIWTGQPSGAVISPTTSAPSSFSFVNGKRILASVIVYPQVVGQITLSDFVNPDVLHTVTPQEVAAMMFLTVPTNWTKCAKTVKVTFSAAPQLPVLEIAYLGPP